jgi:hypothetical protein
MREQRDGERWREMERDGERVRENERDSYRIFLGLQLFLGLRIFLGLQHIIPSKRFGGQLRFLCVLQSECMKVCVLQSEVCENRERERGRGRWREMERERENEKLEICRRDRNSQPPAERETSSNKKLKSLTGFSSGCASCNEKFVK